MFKCKIMEGKEFDIIGFHLDTIEDILKLIEICRNEIDEQVIPTTKFDEIRQYTTKLKRFIEQC